MKYDELFRKLGYDKDLTEKIVSLIGITIEEDNEVQKVNLPPDFQLLLDSVRKAKDRILFLNPMIEIADTYDLKWLVWNWGGQYLPREVIHKLLMEMFPLAETFKQRYFVWKEINGHQFPEDKEEIFKIMMDTATSDDVIWLYHDQDKRGAASEPLLRYTLIIVKKIQKEIQSEIPTFVPQIEP